MDEETLKQISVLHALGQFGLIAELKERSKGKGKENENKDEYKYNASK